MDWQTIIMKKEKKNRVSEQESSPVFLEKLCNK